MAADIKIFPLPLLKEEGNTVVQCAAAEFSIDTINPDSNILLKVKRNSFVSEYNFGKAKTVNFRKEFFLPEVQSEEKAEFIFEYGDEKVITVAMFRPVRKWTVHLVLHSHTDLGFTAPVSEVAEIHNSNTDESILFCRETSHWPEGSKFKWTCEVTWQVQNYLSSRNREQISEFMTHAKNNDIEIAAMYSGELTELLGHEQAARTFYYAAKLRREYNIKIDTAMLCDVPGCTKGFVQLMYKSGIKNLIIADNNFIAPFLQRTDLPRPFYWCGDDNSKVLSWYTDHPFYAYWEGENYGFSKNCTEVQDKLLKKLTALEESGYPYNDFQLQYAFDNFKIQFTPVENVKEWNEKWLYPKIRLSTAGEFLNKMRTQQNEKLPSYFGDWTCWWDGIVNAFPYEEALSRSLHRKIPAIETTSSLLAAITGNFRYPAVEIEKLYNDTLAFDEHSGTGMVWEPQTPEVQEKALREGYGFIYDSANKADELMKYISNTFSGLIKCDVASVAVINPASIDRDINVCIEYLHSDASVTLIDPENGTEINGIINNNKISFTAPSVPGIGFKVFEIKNIIKQPSQFSEPKQTVQNDDKLTLENDYWEITADSKTCQVESVYSKNLMRVINRGAVNIPLLYKVIPVVNIEMGKYVPEVYNGTEVPGELFNFTKNAKTDMHFEAGHQTGKIIISYISGGEKWLEQVISVENEMLLFTNILSGKCIHNKDFMSNHLSSEGMFYFHFPFDIQNSHVKYESTCGVIEPAEEQFKGTCMDYTPVQGWCRLYNNDICINFSSSDAPLIDIGEITLQKYRKEFPSNPSALFIRAVSLKDITGDIKSPYNKEPDLIFRFAISAEKAAAGDLSLQSAYNLAGKMYEHASAVVIPGSQDGIIPGKSCKLITGVPNGVELMTIKKAEDNNDMVIRLREILGTKSSAELKFNFGIVEKAYRTYITEEEISEIEVLNNSIPVCYEPYAVETIRIRFNNEK